MPATYAISVEEWQLLAFFEVEPTKLDADAKVSAKADQLLVDANVTEKGAGTVRLGIDIDAPKDVANVAAWRTLGRSAIQATPPNPRPCPSNDPADWERLAGEGSTKGLRR